MPWWLWMLFGTALLILEVQTGGFYLLFFGVGALVVGMLVAIGLVEADWLQWLLFSGVSMLVLAFLRKSLMARLAPPGTDASEDDLIGEVAVPTEDIAPGQVGKAELRGTAWSARNAGTAALRVGTRARVERVEGLTLWLRAE